MSHIGDINEELVAIPTPLGGRRYVVVKSRKTLVTPEMAAQMLGRGGRLRPDLGLDSSIKITIREKKYRSIDDPWELPEERLDTA